MNDFIKELREPVMMGTLAKMYGVGFGSLKASLAKETDSIVFRAAEKEMEVLAGIRKYLVVSRVNTQ